MNLGSLMDMITKDPTIPDDIQGFVKRVNTPGIAEANGGLTNEDEVLRAIDALKKQPLIEEATKNYQDILDNINSGKISTVNDVKAKYVG